MSGVFAPLIILINAILIQVGQFSFYDLQDCVKLGQGGLE